MHTRKTDKSLMLNGAHLSLNAKAADSLRRSRTSNASGICSPTVLTNRSEKSSADAPAYISVNPYLQPRKDVGASVKPASAQNDSTDNSIDEYWLGFPAHSAGRRKTDSSTDNKSKGVPKESAVFRWQASSTLTASSFQRNGDNLPADSLNEFIELENKIKQQVDGNASFANGGDLKSGPVLPPNGSHATAKQNGNSSKPALEQNAAARRIQRWFRRIRSDRIKIRSSLHQIMREKHRQYSTTLVQDRKTAMTPAKKGNSAFSDQGRALRQKAIDELKTLREQRRLEIERKAKEELARLEAEGKINGRSNRNKIGYARGAIPRATSARTLSSSSATGNLTEEPLDNVSSVDGDDIKNDLQQAIISETVSSVDVARTKSTLEDLLSTIHQLEKDAVVQENTDSGAKLPTNKTLAWLEEVDKNSTVDDRQENHTKWSPRFRTQSESVHEHVKDNEGSKPAAPVNEDLTSWLPLPLSQRAESVATYLDGVQSSHRRIDDIDQTMAKQEEDIRLALKNMNSAAKVADLQQLERASAEITSKCLQQQAELEAKQHTIKMLQTALNQQRELIGRQAKELAQESKKQMSAQESEHQSAIQRHLSFIDQLILEKQGLTERYEKMVAETRELERKSANRIKDMEEQHVVEIKKIREFEQAAEKLRREKWIAEREKRIKEATVKGLEPEIQRIIAQHKDEVRKIKSQHEADMLAGDERAAQKYVKLVEELRQQLADEKEEACRRERELAKQRYESALTQERMQLQQTEKRLYGEVASERERLADQGQRQRSELESLQRQLEETHRSALELMRQEYDRAKKDQEEKHTKELREFEERVKIEKQMWEEQYMKKQETWLMTKERELKEKVRVERDREIEAVIAQLEGDTRRQREEVERSAENRVKRLREKYDSEINELERSERQTSSKYNETKAKLAETEGELERVRAVLRQKESELNDLTSDVQKLRDERGRVADIVRQELADRLVAVEEENGRMKAELAEQKARSKSEAERLREEIAAVQRSKEVELDEIHQRVKQAVAKKEEAVTQLRQQYEAATRRADHLEGLLEQQRKQLIGNVPAGTARSGASVAHSVSGKK